MDFKVENNIGYFRSRKKDDWFKIETLDDLKKLKDVATNSNMIYFVLKDTQNNIPKLYDKLAKESKTDDVHFNSLYLRGKLNYCETCGKPCELHRRYCCFQCSVVDPQKYERQQQTNLEKFGYKFRGQCPDAKEKRKVTLKEKYGNEKYVNVELRQQRNLKRFGTREYVQTEEFKKKSRDTCLEKYGVESYSQTEQCKDQYVKTCLERYGVENCSQTEQCKEKRRNTCLKKYGVESILDIPGFHENIKDICLDRYGVDHYGNSYEHKLECNNEYYTMDDIDKVEYLRRYQQMFDVEFVKSRFIDCEGYFLWKDFCQYFKVGASYIYNYKTRNNIINANARYDELEQKDLFKLIEAEDKILNSRKIIPPQELDIYIPFKNFAIEYNGIMFHSIGDTPYSFFNSFKDPMYHYNKYLKCKEKNISLFSIFDYQDRTRWLSIINDVLDKNINIIGGIKEIDVKLVKQFVIDNCITDEDNESINYIKCLGEYDNNELIRVSIFKDNQIQYLVSKLGYSYDFKHHIEYYKKIYNFDELIIKINNCFGNWFIHNIDYKEIELIKPIAKYFDRRRCYKPKFSLDNQWQDFGRAVYNCGYTVYQL